VYRRRKMHATKLRKGEALAKMLKICVEKFDGHFDKAGMPYIFLMTTKMTKTRAPLWNAIDTKVRR
jgi:hypothetical protein